MASFAPKEYFDRSINSWIPEGDQQAFKIAFYNAVVLAFIACCGAVVVAVFFLLQAVLKSMLWAMLCGTVLFPFKKRLNSAIEWYLSALKDTGTPLSIGIIVAPLAVLDRGADLLWRSVISRSSLCFLIGYVVVSVSAYQCNFTLLLNTAAACYRFLDGVVWLYSCSWVRGLAVIYAAVFFGYVYLLGAEANKVVVRVCSVPLWMVGLCTIAQLFGPLRVLVAVSAAIVVLLIVLRVIDAGENEGEGSSEDEKSVKDMTAAVSSSSKPASEPAPVPTEGDQSAAAATTTGESFGNRCIRTIVGACGLLWVTEHPSALVILILLLIYGIMKRTGEYFDLRQRATTLLCGGATAFQEKFKHILDAVFPSTLRKFVKLLFYGDRRIIDGLRDSAGILSTIFVMIVLLTTSVLVGGILIFQIQSEAVHLITVTSSIINQSVSGNVQFSSWVSKAINVDDLREGGLDTMVDNAYQYGRVWLPKQARMLIKDDAERADLMEAQVKMILDKVYQMWEESRTTTAPTGDGFANAMAANKPTTGTQLTQVWEHVRGSMDIRAVGMELIGFVKENVSMLLSILETVWSVLSANVTFLFSISAAILGLLLSFGLELLNCFIGIIVFLTMLYYLLAYSQSEWKPIEWLTMFTPGVGNSQNAFSKSVEAAISNVFILSFKMALFYGFYMWFIHSVFALNVTVIPSILAAILAAVPFLAPYWVCVPGAIELALVRGEPLLAVLFFVFGFAPTMVVDGAFYREVKGSHPYLTGLSVVGGIYWLGLEGAFIGPILLCCMLVLMDMYKNVLRS